MDKIGVTIMQLSLIVLAFAGGWLGFSYINHVSTKASEGIMWILGVILVTIAAAVIGLVLNIILHEAGHLVGGLLCGYSFVFFSVLNQSIIKENGKLVRKKYRAPGTGGGCMLSPPDMKEGTYPYKLFISSGFLMNFLVSAVCFILFYCLADSAEFWARAFLIIGIVGAFLGLTNLTPHKVVAPSDGYLFFNLGNEKNTEMRRGLWSSSRFQALIAEGTRPRNIPEELFDWVDIGHINDPLVFETACNYYRYLLDQQELADAGGLMRALCHDLKSIHDMQKMSYCCELLFHELIGECRQAEMDRLYTKELKDYIKSAHAEVSVQRLMYAYSRIVLKDTARTKESLALFHKACAMPLQLGFVSGEQELIELIDTIAEHRENN